MGIQTPRTGQWSSKESLEELAQLAKTANVEVIQSISQPLEHPHTAHYVGSGKLSEINEIVGTYDINTLIADDELSPAQQKTLEQKLKIKIMDRTALILDIFAARANTHEAQLQVELAQLEYLMPRLTRMWTHLSRLGGGIGTRGPGEKQLETDKRQIKTRIAYLKSEIKKISAHRQRHREKRGNLPMITAAIVGYTNAGKSTLLNKLTGSTVFAKDSLFATLDPTTRRLNLANQSDILVTDTVGFIQKLPHKLVVSFKATLEEAIFADFLIHVVDISHPKWEAMIQISRDLFAELGIEDKPTLIVFNKEDQIEITPALHATLQPYAPYCLVSVLTPDGITKLKESLDHFLTQFEDTFEFSLPYSRMDLVNLIHRYGKIEEKTYDGTIHIRAKLNKVIGTKIMSLLTKKEP